jgi:hypothetical protein
MPPLSPQHQQLSALFVSHATNRRSSSSLSPGASTPPGKGAGAKRAASRTSRSSSPRSPPAGNTVAELEQQVAQLGAEVERLNALYHDGRPAVTDDVYDSIKANLKAAEVGSLS